MITLVSTDLKTIPNYLNGLINADRVSGQFSLIKFKLKFSWIKLLPIDYSGVRISPSPLSMPDRNVNVLQQINVSSHLSREAADDQGDRESDAEHDRQ